MNSFSPKDGVPVGKRFSDVYRERGKPIDDSARMRWRIAAVLTEYGQSFEQRADAEFGISTPYSRTSSWRKCLEDWHLDDVLNIITLLVQYAASQARTESGVIVARRREVHRFNQIFEQENVVYRVDSQGGVHFVHDEEFVLNAKTTIAGLNQPKYANSLDRFESAMKSINSAVPDGKTGIRNVFESAKVCSD